MAGSTRYGAALMQGMISRAWSGIRLGMGLGLGLGLGSGRTVAYRSSRNSHVSADTWPWRTLKVAEIDTDTICGSKPAKSLLNGYSAFCLTALC